jgi:hypothetical protein
MTVPCRNLAQQRLRLPHQRSRARPFFRRPGEPHLSDCSRRQLLRHEVSCCLRSVGSARRHPAFFAAVRLRRDVPVLASVMQRRPRKRSCGALLPVPVLTHTKPHSSLVASACCRTSFTAAAACRSGGKPNFFRLCRMTTPIFVRPDSRTVQPMLTFFRTVMASRMARLSACHHPASVCGIVLCQGVAEADFVAGRSEVFATVAGFFDLVSEAGTEINLRDSEVDY